MTETSPRNDPDGTTLWSRRTALKVAALSAATLAASGCGVDVVDGGQTGRRLVPRATPSSTEADVDIRLALDAIRDEERLLAFGRTTARRFPSEHELLAGFVDRQAQHVSRLRASLADLRPPVSHPMPALPRRPGDLLPALADVATSARDDRSADCLAATSGLLAELFGSIAASHAVSGWLAEPYAAAPAVSIPGSEQSVDALQPCLAAEHAAVFGYGVVGGVLSAGVSDAPPAVSSVSSYDVHRDRRDALVDLIQTGGAEPVAPEAAYETPFRVDGLPSARRLAQYLESACATVYARAVAATIGEPRRLVSTTLIDCAIRGARWGAAPSAFPGLVPR